MKIKLFATIMIAAAFSFNCGSKTEETNSIPDWIRGTWKGSFGFEHDTVSYDLIIELKSESDFLAIPKRNVQFDLFLDSVSNNQVRFKMKKTEPKSNSAVPNGILDLIRLESLPENTVHIQFYPHDRQELWLGKAEKTG